MRRGTAVLIASVWFSMMTGCGGPAPAKAVPPIPPLSDARGHGKMPDVHPTQMGAALKAAGLDPAHLPPIETLDRGQRLKVMRTFTEALGVACVDCHADGDFAADTRRKRVAKRMYNEMVRVTALESGEPVYCDSCHQGALFTLERSDKSRISDYMSDVLVGKLKRVDGRDHDCGTCHGDPPDFAFLKAWKSAPAPDITRTSSSTPQAPRVAAPAAAAPAPAPSSPPKPAARPAAKVSKDCGDKGNLCPLQAWMRKNVATAVAANDAAALAKALDRVSTMAPDPSWTQWGELSRAAAEAARGGDVAEARKSCQGCHNAFKAKWRESYRTRAVK